MLRLVADEHLAQLPGSRRRRRARSVRSYTGRLTEGPTAPRIAVRQLLPAPWLRGQDESAARWRRMAMNAAGGTVSAAL